MALTTRICTVCPSLCVLQYCSTVLATPNVDKSGAEMRLDGWPVRSRGSTHARCASLKECKSQAELRVQQSVALDRQ